jgi:hypothetical protein
MRRELEIYQDICAIGMDPHRIGYSRNQRDRRRFCVRVWRFMILRAIVAMGRFLVRAPFHYVVLIRIFFVKGSLVLELPGREYQLLEGTEVKQ